ncbi:hypothetical protein OF83DRAFT_1142337 [Amylostereum chailletii]|nr:hypothetical protein OF83DRAFT_1142337 [Amylostereum chailletii]
MDISQRQGLYPPPPGASTLLGVEFSGLVLQLGSEVQGIAVGDAVIGLAGGGAYAEYIAAPAANVVKKPAHLSWTEAASIPENFLTAYQALLLVAELKAGDHVLIHAGASGVGVAAIQLARYFGAATVTATASTAEKLSWLLSLPAGPTHVANYRTADFAATVQDATGGHGADVVVDMVGQSHWHANVRSMALDGRMTILSSLSGSEVAKVDLGPILYKRLRIQGSTLRSRPLEYQAALVARCVFLPLSFSLSICALSHPHPHPRWSTPHACPPTDSRKPYPTFPAATARASSARTSTRCIRGRRSRRPRGRWKPTRTRGRSSWKCATEPKGRAGGRRGQ